MIKRHYIFNGEEGFHVRPVTVFTKLVKAFESDVRIHFEGEAYNGKSPLEIMSACIEDQMAFDLELDGPDEKALDQAIRETMVLGEEPFFQASRTQSRPDDAPEPVTQAGHAAEDDAQRPAGAYQGLGVSPGLGVGRAFVFHPFDVAEEQARYTAKAASAKHEQTVLADAVDRLDRDLQEDEARYGGGIRQDLIRAHRELLSDETFQQKLISLIETDKRVAADAVLAAARYYQERFSHYQQERMRLRMADIQDLCYRLYEKITGRSNRLQVTGADRVIVAQDLLPSQTMSIKADQVAGFILEQGGPNAHTAILARSLGIPALSGVSGLLNLIRDGQTIALDADTGYFLIDPDEQTQKRFEQVQAQRRDERRLLLATDAQPNTQTADGVVFSLLANVQALEEVDEAVAHGAEGIGLFRTEFLYMNRATPPAAEEQFEAYKQALLAMKGQPVTFRTLDAGGDKPIESLVLPQESNPFLGVRGIRYSLQGSALFQEQLRALLMASAFGPVKIMFPMVSILEEVIQARRLLETARKQLIQDGHPVGDVEVGIMIETPSAALISNRLAEHIDFMSIGSNDLVQYTLAADRGNAALAGQASVYHPSVLALVETVARAARNNHIPWTVCGESAADPLAALFYVACGVSGLSLSPYRIPEQRRFFRQLDLGKAAINSEAISQLIAMATAEEAKNQLIRYTGNGTKNR